MKKAEPTPDRGSWLDELNRLLTATPDLGPAQWVDREKALLRLITPRPHGQLVAAALERSQAVMDHLATWTGPPSLQIVLAQTDFVPDGSPRITARDGSVWIECGDDPEAASPATFAGWFKALTGRPFPFLEWGADLQPAGPQLWLPAGATRSDMYGFPHTLALKGRDAYRMGYFGGHGCNSYAVYLTDVRPGLELRLRLPFGGIYGDPERDSAGVVGFVEAIYKLVDQLAGRLTHFGYTSNMRSDRARLVGAGGEWQGPVEGLAEVARFAEEIAAGRMPERPSEEENRRRPPWARS